MIDILEKVRGILRAMGLSPDVVDGLNPQDGLFEQGLLDSIDLIELILKIEREFKIRIPTGAFDPLNFNNLRAIAASIQRRLPPRDQK